MGFTRNISRRRTLGLGSILLMTAASAKTASDGSALDAGWNSDEPTLEPELPIVDPHHHFWFHIERILAAAERANTPLGRGSAPAYRRYPNYLFDDFLKDTRSGHNIVASVFIEANMMYRR